MKRLISLLAVTGIVAAAWAQDDVQVAPSEKYSVTTNGFWHNWFVSADATWSAFYSQERALVAPFRKFPGGSEHTNMGLSLAFGKWFTPGLGLRTKLGLWQWGKEEQGIGGDKFWSLNEQVLFNLSNLLRGYHEQRLWNLIPYIGAGVNRNMSHSHYSTQLSAGLLNTFRISRHLSANLDLGWNNFEAGSQGLGIKNRAHQFSLEVGLTYHIGSSRWNHATDNDAKDALTEGELDAVNAQLADALAENDRLQQELDARPEVTVQPAVQPAVRQEVKYAAVPISIFFDKGKAVSVAPRDVLNMKAVAEYAKEHPVRLVVTGYADSRTGSAEGNLKLSQRRADAVADELVRLGVQRNMIDVVAAGGVDALSPSDFNRRVTIEMK